MGYLILALAIAAAFYYRVPLKAWAAAQWAKFKAAADKDKMP